MKNKRTFYNFLKNETADFLTKKFGIEFDTFQLIEMEKIVLEDAKNIYSRNGHKFYKNGEDEFMMFYYKKYYYVNWSGKEKMPVYHPYEECETMKTYSGFVYSNSMPVDIYSKKSKKKYPNQYLKLCRNCKRAIFKTWFGNKNEWYEILLVYINNQSNPTFKKDGYHSFWKQISEAYRENVNFCCENPKCKVQLNSKYERYYLHTLHKDGNIKNNKTENFEALCLLCHGLEHKNKLKKENAFSEIDEFINKFQNRLNSNIINEYRELFI